MATLTTRPVDVARARSCSRFVGRDDDEATLEAALAQAGHGQADRVVAAVGTGKRRIANFAARHRERLAVGG